MRIAYCVVCIACFNMVFSALWAVRKAVLLAISRLVVLFVLFYQLLETGVVA